MRRFHSSISSSLVAKTTLKILLASALISVVISAVAIYLIRGYQTQALNERITQLATTVENTAAIAAFTSDTELAKEVAHGLLTNHIVSNVRISSVLPSKKTLVLSALPGTAQPTAVVAYQRELYSPFNAVEVVGILEVWLKPSEVKKQAASYSVLVTVSLFCVVFSITWILIQVINLSVIHPIKRISDDMHALDLSKEHLLSSPKNIHDDEIGRLVGDINALIQRLKSLLSTEKALRLSKELSEQRLRMIFDKSQTGIFLMNEHQRLISWNPAFLSMLGIHSQVLEVHNAPTLTQLLPQHADLLNGMIMSLFATNHSVSMTVPLEVGNRTSWLEISMMAIDRHDIQVVFNDVTVHKLAELAAIQQSELDALTGLLNRRGVLPRLHTIIQQSTLDARVTVLLIDLDGFKPVNDQYGHDAGDAVLIAVSRHLESAVRKDDLVSRLGGDEFMVILPKVVDETVVGLIAQHLIEAVEEPIMFGNLQLKVSCSIGIAMYDQTTQTPDDLLKRADIAMYEAKAAGKARFQFCHT